MSGSEHAADVGPGADRSGAAEAQGQDGPPPIEISLPATSANVGPGFDALGLALSLILTLRARTASQFSITATGRDAHVTGDQKNNLIRTTYEDVLRAHGRAVLPLELVVENEIPIGVGCGSSAAALCGGVLLASHFGELGWSTQEVLDEAARREGHPDNVAACLMGGLTASVMSPGEPGGGRPETVALTLGGGLGWRLLLALPKAALSTVKARALLPKEYRREDAVGNVQATALLVAAFAQNRPDLLYTATADRMHQPYRAEVCPLLGALLPLAGRNGIFSVTLSGAGPAVLLIVDEEVNVSDVREAGGDLLAEVAEVRIAEGASARGWVMA